MERLTFLGNLFSYDHWATGRVLEAIEDQNVTSNATLKLIAHILVCQDLWLRRLAGEDTVGTDVWPDASLDRCRQLHGRMYKKMSAFLASLSEDNLDKPFSYRNLEGKERHVLIADVLTQLALHGQYHRGELVEAFRSDGGTMVSNDYYLYAIRRSRQEKE